MQVLAVASECAPLVKTGGLADVAGALPKALAAEGVRVRTLLPGYPAVRAAAREGTEAAAFPDLFGGPARLVAAGAAGLDLLVLDAPHLFDRPGNPYLGPDRKDWPDNAFRYAALAHAALAVATGSGGWQPDLVHAHDWQAGLAPALLRHAGSRVPSVLTIHNIAFQGLFPAGLLAPLGLPAADFTPEGLEYYGQIGFLKAGLVHADRLTTVSPTYARELAWPEFGMGLEGVIARRRAGMRGILNGADTHVWDPATDPHLAAPFSAGRMRGKAENRAAILARFRLEDRGGPLFVMVSRLTAQKGVDLLVETLPRLAARGAALAVLGSGDAPLEAALAAAAGPAVGIVIGYDEPLAHLLIGGGDVILVPSRFEPCGLTQLYGLRYGTLPLVARTGGLADTVIDANEAALARGVATGFVCAPGSAAALGDAIDRAADLWADRRAWAAVQRRAMTHPVGWEASAAAYAALFRELVPA